jgi:leader peptidase (prepilin peptidase)/N-methyltransferase
VPSTHPAASIGLPGIGVGPGVGVTPAPDQVPAPPQWLSVVGFVEMPAWFPVAVAAAYGLVLGSFLNVVVYRLPRGMSLLRPGSHCPGCGAPVRWYDNVPVLSFLALGGKCRRCGARISLRYPAIELLTGALLAACVVRFGVSVAGGEAMLLALLLVPLAFIDLEHHLLPDALTLPGIAAGLALSAAGGLTGIADAAIGAAVGGALPYLVIVVYRAIRGVEGMGLGDVKLLAMVGAFLGWRGALLTIGIGSCVGAVVGIALIASGRGKRDTELPFGVFLAIAAAVVLFSGPDLVRALGWVGE